jgi:hypothetical protein
MTLDKKQQFARIAVIANKGRLLSLGKHAAGFVFDAEVVDLNTKLCALDGGAIEDNSVLMRIAELAAKYAITSSTDYKDSIQYSMLGGAETIALFGQGAFKGLSVEVKKVDKFHKIVMGWAIISQVAGQDYYDLHGDNLPEDVMFESSVAFMRNYRVGKDMHYGSQIGTVVFAWPMTKDVAASLGMTSNISGLLIGMQIEDADILAKYASGEYTGFSLGGFLTEEPEVIEEPEAENAA